MAMAKVHHETDVQLTQFENAVLLNAIDMFVKFKRNGLVLYGVSGAVEALDTFAMNFATDCCDEEMELKLANPDEGWKNR